MNWLEVSLSVDGELAEAVADVLARFAPNGVVTEQGVRYINDDDPGTGAGPITVRAYLPVDDHLEQTRQNLEEALFYLGMIQPLPVPSFKPIAEQNWMEAWKQHYKPIPIGKRLMIVPAWIDSQDSDRIAIKIEPGMAFGTGTHPTTQLCLEMIEKSFVRAGGQPPLRVIDVGCGSGILAIAALKLGAAAVLGVDIDPESVRNARENANINGIGEEFILKQGSIAAIQPAELPFKQAPLVVANILASVIIRLFDSGLANLIEPGGTIILSGIMKDQAQAVIETAQARGLRMIEEHQLGDWVALAMGY